ETGITFGTKLEKAYDANFIEDTTWSHLAVTWAKGVGVTAHVRSATCALEETKSEAGTGAVPDAVGTLYFGDNRSSAVSGETHTSLASANGTFDLIRIYNHSLTATELNADCNNTAYLHHLEITSTASTIASAG